MEENFVIMTEKTFSSVMAYLKSRPYAEVGGSIPSIEHEVGTLASTKIVVPKEYANETIDEIHLNKKENE